MAEPGETFHYSSTHTKEIANFNVNNKTKLALTVLCITLKLQKRNLIKNLNFTIELVRRPVMGQAARTTVL